MDATTLSPAGQATAPPRPATPRPAREPEPPSLQLEFDYGDLPKAEVSALERHAKKIAGVVDQVRRIQALAVIAIGCELKEAQGRLANHGDGTFGKWVAARWGSPAELRTASSRRLKPSEIVPPCHNLSSATPSIPLIRLLPRGSNQGSHQARIQRREDHAQGR